MRSGGSYIGRGRREGVAEGAIRAATGRWGRRRSGRGDGSDRRARKAASRRMLGYSVAFKTSIVCQGTATDGPGLTSHRYFRVTRLMHARQKTTYSATKGAGRSRTSHSCEESHAAASYSYGLPDIRVLILPHDQMLN